MWAARLSEVNPWLCMVWLTLCRLEPQVWSSLPRCVGSAVHPHGPPFSSVLHCSPAFTFPHPINPVAYQQILSQQRGLGSAFGHTPPLIQPSPTFLAQQSMALTSISTMPAQLSSNSSNCLNDGSQVGGCENRRWATAAPMLGAGGDHCTLA